MPASEAQIRANRLNAAKSSGPKTMEGKQASRANAYKHGLTGAGVVSLEREAALVEGRYRSICKEMKTTGAVGDLLALRAAMLSVRMERCVEHEDAALKDRVGRAEADFVPPEGADDAEAALLRERAGKLALFDGSKESTLARKYEAAAERGFFRCIKELRAMEKEDRKARDEAIEHELASFSSPDLSDDEFDELSARMGLPPLPKATKRPDRVGFADHGGRVDVPIAIGKRP